MAEPKVTTPEITPEITSAPVENTGKVVLPKEVQIVGELLNVDKVELESGDLFLLTLQDVEDKTHIVATSVGFWEKVGRGFAAGAIVKCDVEKRIKDVTSYEDDMGVMKKHTSDGNNLSRISRYSTRAFEAALALKLRQSNESFRDADAAKIMDAEATHAGALATYLGATFGK